MDKIASTHFDIDLLKNIEAEKSLLGLLLNDNSKLEELSDYLNENFFFLKEHQTIFKATKTLIDRGKTADPTTLKNYFEANKQLDEIGGDAYLFTLTDDVNLFVNPADYVNVLHALLPLLFRMFFQLFHFHLPRKFYEERQNQQGLLHYPMRQKL